ncbi:MAG: MFS transporter [Caldilineaceae bacterium]
MHTKKIRTSELTLLALYPFINLSIGGGLLPLLPIYATQLGADPSQIGLYMALTYVALTVSTLISGRIIDALSDRRYLAVGVGLGVIPALWWMAVADSMWELTVATMLAWFVGGGSLALGFAFAGMAAGPKERGKVFGVVAAAMGVGSLAGNLVAGSIADRWGYPTLLMSYAIYAIFLAVTPLLIAVAKPQQATAAANHAGASEPDLPGTGTTTGVSVELYLLALATVLTGSMGFMAILGRSLAMNALHYTSAEIGLAAAMGSAVAIPLPIWLGNLSDRYARGNLLAICYGVLGLSLVLLAVATAQWHFWVVSLLMAISNGTGGIVNALVADLVPPRLIGTGLSYTNGASWIGAVIGFLSTGYLIETLGITSAFLSFTILPPLAIFIVLSIGRVRRRRAATT